MNLFLLVWFLRLCGTLGARGDGGGRSGQDGFSTLFNPAIPWIPNHTMYTKPYHGYQTIPCIPNHTMDTKLYHGYQTIPWMPNQTMTKHTLSSVPNYTTDTKPYDSIFYITHQTISHHQLCTLLHNVPVPLPTLPCNATYSEAATTLYIEVRMLELSCQMLHNVAPQWLRFSGLSKRPPHPQALLCRWPFCMVSNNTELHIIWLCAKDVKMSLLLIMTFIPTR